MIEGKYLRSQKNLYFLCLYKSLRVVNKFMDLEWCLWEKNQIPPQSARTEEFWSNHIFRFQTFVTKTFECSLGLIFDFVRK